MILIRSSKVRDWLASIEKNQDWLAGELRIGKAYLSQILHNRCKISRNVMEHIVTLSHIPFESLFFMDNQDDMREFYGADIFFQGDMMRSEKYNHLIDEILSSNPPKNGNGKNNNDKDLTSLEK